MAKEITKLVSNRTGSARAVGAALEVHVAKRAAQIEQALGVKAGRKLSVSELVDALRTALLSRASELEGAEQAYAEELGDDPPARDARDAAVVALRTSIDEIAGTISGAFGAESLSRYKLDQSVPVAPDMLVTYAKNAAKSVKRGAPKTTPRKGRKLDFAVLASELEAGAASLKKTLDVVKREEREAEGALAARDAKIAAFEPAYGGIASIAAGLLELAGEPDLGERVKPTARRKAGLEAAPEVPPVEPPRN
ncbi:MAG: hypothetical protein U0234_32795 [Sandaracinus sp.]